MVHPQLIHRLNSYLKKKTSQSHKINSKANESIELNNPTELIACCTLALLCHYLSKFVNTLVTVIYNNESSLLKAKPPL